MATTGAGDSCSLWGGWPFFQRGWNSLVNRYLNMFTLIALGTGTAYLYSLVATVAPNHFPQLSGGMAEALKFTSKPVLSS